MARGTYESYSAALSAGARAAFGRDDPSSLLLKNGRHPVYRVGLRRCS